MIKEWGWTSEKVDLVNQYSDWSMMQKVELGNRINKILMASYKHISEKNKELDPSESLITEKDTHLLGRKLFSFYKPAPNKVDNLGALVDGKTAEKELTFILKEVDINDKSSKPEWYLLRGKIASIAELDTDRIIRKSATLQFLLAFAVFNSLYSENTKVWLIGEGESIKENEVNSLLQILKKFIESVNIAALSNEDLLSNSEVSQLFILVDFGSPPPAIISMGNIKDCKTKPELSKFVNQRIERIKNITTIYLTSWGELYCKSYAGLNCLTRCISDLGPQLKRVRIENIDFLKVYIPSGRKEILTLPWLNSYVTQSLKIKSSAQVQKVAT